MRVRLSALATVTAILLLLTAGAAQASCENRSFIGFGPGNQPTGPGADPDSGMADAGGTVTVVGQKFEPGSIARVRIGISGPVLGEAMADEAGDWTVTFQLASDMAAGGYLIYADAFHRSGEMVPASKTLHVRSRDGGPPAQQQPQGTPVPQGAPAGAPQATEAGPPVTAHEHEPGARGTATAPQSAAPAAASPSAVVQPEPATEVESPATSTDAPAAEARTRERSATPSETRRAYTLDGPVDDKAMSRAPPLTVAPRFGVESGDDGTLVIAIGSVVLLVAVAGGGYAVARRRPPHADVPAEVVPPAGPLPEPARLPEPVVPAAPAKTADPVEAALQEMIAEERARQADKPLAPVG